MNKAIFIGGQEDCTTRQLEGKPTYLHFIEHPKNNTVFANAEKNNYEYKELTYRLLFSTPNGVLIYELVTEDE